MSAESGFLPPGDYPITWPLLGGFILLAIFLWAVVIWLATRAPEGRAGVPLPPEAVSRLRTAALAEVDATERAVRAGERTARQGHHELSRIVRGFVAQASGLDADRMTAQELRARGPAHLARLIEAYYPRQFGVDEAEPPQIRPAAGAAREVIGGWC